MAFAWAPILTSGAAAEQTAGFSPLRPARVVLDRIFPASATTVDLSADVGRIPLAHPEAVAAIDCAQARCELDEGAVQVRAISAAVTALTMHVHLSPHYVLLRNGTADSTITQTIAVLHCPAEIISGAPLRGADATNVLVRLGGRCGGDQRELRWGANGEPATVVRTAKEGDSLLVLLTVGDLEDATLTLTATRPEADGSVVAVAHTPTRPAPLARATLELPGHGPIDFIPTNRDAEVHVAPVGNHAYLVPLPEEGAYRVTADARRHGRSGRGQRRWLRRAPFRLSGRGASAPVRGDGPGRPDGVAPAPDSRGQHPGADRPLGARPGSPGGAALHGRARQPGADHARGSEPRSLSRAATAAGSSFIANVSSRRTARRISTWRST